MLWYLNLCKLAYQVVLVGLIYTGKGVVTAEKRNIRQERSDEKYKSPCVLDFKVEDGLSDG